jgi:hypothetical protein
MLQVTILIFIHDKNFTCLFACTDLHANIDSEDVPNGESCNAVRRFETPNT